MSIFYTDHFCPTKFTPRKKRVNRNKFLTFKVLNGHKKQKTTCFVFPQTFDIITQIYLPYLRHFATLVAATFSDFEQSGQYILTVIQSSMYRTRYKYFFHELPRTHTHDTCTNFCMEA